MFLFCFTHIDINVACIRNDPELELALQCDARWFAEHVILTFPQILPPLSMSRSTIVFELEDDVKHQEPLLQEDPGEDDNPDGGAGTDHVHVRHGHVLQTETWWIGKVLYK